MLRDPTAPLRSGDVCARNFLQLPRAKARLD
jgi:hypothetical protein